RSSDLIAIELRLDASNNLQLAQYEAIKHNLSPENNADSSESSPLTAGLLHVTQTVTDGDGDTATFTNGTGLSVSILDDGPTANFTQSQTASVTEDETALVQAGTNDQALPRPAAFAPGTHGSAESAGSVGGTDFSSSGTARKA